MFEAVRLVDLAIVDRVPIVGVRGRFPDRGKQEAVIAQNLNC